MTAIIDSGLPEMPAPSEVALAGWEEWVSTRPGVVSELCRSFPPWFYYDMPKTGQIVTIVSYSENETLTVRVVGDRISVPAVVQFEVFGVPPADLVKRSNWMP